MKRNVFKFVPTGLMNDYDFQLNGVNIGAHWPDADGWKSPYDTGNRGLVYWYVYGFNGFASTMESARTAMLAVAKQEVERERRARYRK